MLHIKVKSMKLAQNKTLVQSKPWNFLFLMLSSPFSFHFPSFACCSLSRPNRIRDRDWKRLGSASWWLDEATAHPHHTTKFRGSSFTLHAVHPCATVPILCTDHAWQKLFVCTCARPGWLCWHVPMMWRGIRAQLSERSRLLWVSAAMQAGSGFAGKPGLRCLFVCSFPVSCSVWVLSVSISELLPCLPLTSDFLLSLTPSPSLNIVFSSMATGLVLVLGSA